MNFNHTSRLYRATTVDFDKNCASGNGINHSTDRLTRMQCIALSLAARFLLLRTLEMPLLFQLRKFCKSELTINKLSFLSLISLFFTSEKAQFNTNQKGLWISQPTWISLVHGRFSNNGGFDEFRRLSRKWKVLKGSYVIFSPISEISIRLNCVWSCVYSS